MKRRYCVFLAMLLTMMLTVGNALAQVTVKGSVFGGGNAADVKINTTVNISYGTVEGNVYGGGNLGDVGRIDKTDASYNYKWTVDESGNTTETYNNTGVCNVNITGGTIGTTGSGNGYVFGMGIITDVKQELRRCSALKIMYGATKGGKVK